jgi:hypothetical protein
MGQVKWGIFRKDYRRLSEFFMLFQSICKSAVRCDCGWSQLGGFSVQGLGGSMPVAETTGAPRPRLLPAPGAQVGLKTRSKVNLKAWGLPLDWE